MTKYRVVRCQCGFKFKELQADGTYECQDWHVTDIADVQGVKFTEAQAEAVAQLLNGDFGDRLE